MARSRPVRESLPWRPVGGRTCSATHRWQRRYDGTSQRRRHRHLVLGAHRHEPQKESLGVRVHHRLDLERRPHDAASRLAGVDGAPDPTATSVPRRVVRMGPPVRCGVNPEGDSFSVELARSEGLVSRRHRRHNNSTGRVPRLPSRATRPSRQRCGGKAQSRPSPRTWKRRRATLAFKMPVSVAIASTTWSPRRPQAVDAAVICSLPTTGTGTGATGTDTGPTGTPTTGAH